jgi:hypothetical protein
MSEKEIENIKKKYLIKLNNLIRELESSFHTELFEEEYNERYDSNSDSENRKLGINPMNEEYITKVSLKRKKINVSKLGKNGLPTDNSSEIYIKKIITEYLSNNYKIENIKENKKLNINSFFKQQNKQ